VRKACGKYFVVLNNDLEVCEGWLDCLAEPFDDRQVKQVGVRQEWGCNGLLASGGGMIAAVDEYVEASIMMIPADFARSIGLFSSEYEGFYCEDADLSLRIRAMGYQIRLIDLPVYHHRAISTYRSGEPIDYRGYEARNRAIFRNKWSKYLKTKSFSERILVKRKHAIGDVFWIEPILAELKRRNVFAEIFVQTLHGDLFLNNPAVAGLVTIHETIFPEGLYDRIIELNGAYEKNPAVPIVIAYAQAAGLDNLADPQPKLYFTDQEINEAKGIIGSPGRIAVFHTGKTNWIGRNYPLESFRQIAESLKASGWFIVEVGANATDSMGNADLNLITKLLIRQTAAVISQADLFVGIDSSCSNIAQAFGIPAVIIFGCVNPYTRLLDRPYIKGAWNESLACRGCHQWQGADRYYNEACPRGLVKPEENELCLKSILPSDVLKIIEGVLK
jgi:ADP-heptose:LPS heptosyltransferase